MLCNETAYFAGPNDGVGTQRPDLRPTRPAHQRAALGYLCFLNRSFVVTQSCRDSS